MIPPEILADIKARYELVAFIEAQGIALKKSGDAWLGRCPFHSDKGPSLSVSRDKQLWCCLGACSANGKTLGGDVIEFAKRRWGMTFRETVEKLGGALDAPPPPAASRPTLRRASGAPRSRHAALAPAPNLLGQVSAYYHQTFLDSAAAKAYASARGLTNSELVSALAIGFADGSLLDRAPEGSETHAALAGLGVLNGGGHERFAGCMVFPLRDLAGNVVGFYGRDIENDRHVYLPGPRRGLVNAQCAATTDELIVAESVIDAVSFLQAGIANAVPIYGTNGWTPDHDELLEKHRIRRVVLALDNDDAGKKATAALGEKLAERGLDVVSVELPANDPNELLVKEGPAGFAERWASLARASVTPAHALTPADAGVGARAQAPAPVHALARDAQARASALSRTPAREAEEPAAKERNVNARAANLDTEAGAYVIPFASRTYRVRGLAAFGVDRMRVNVRVEQGARFHVDTFDLYAHVSRRRFIDAAAVALGQEPSAHADFSNELSGVIDALERERLALRAQGKGEAEQKPMSAAERDEALAFLRAPDLMARLAADFEALGCVGEATALTTAYLAALSRKLPEPLAVLFCARSGAGKSNLQDRITELVPPEELVRYTRITGQALFYQDENALVHKLLAIDEEEGAAEAAYSLRNLQSGGSLSVSATRTDPQTGKQKAEAYKVNGPTSIFLTTAHPEALDYETRNRFVILTVDESKEQTRRILERQRWADTLDGLLADENRAAIIRRHHNAGRLLAAVRVVIPFAESLVYPSDRLMHRREQKKFLSLIKVLALFHQHQRVKKSINGPTGAVEFIEATAADVALASELAPLILRRNLDELAPPARSLLLAIRDRVRSKMREEELSQEEATLDRQEIKKVTGFSYHQIRDYVVQLVECEYLALVRGESGKRHLYRLLWLDGDDEAEPALGLIALMELEGVTH